MERKLSLVVVGLFLAGLACTTAALAQRGGWGPGSRYARMYDSRTAQTVSGEVVSVERFTPARGMSSGIHLMLRIGKEDISVHLGPAWFIDKQGVRIEPKDKVEVTGSRVTFDGKPAIIAAQVKKGSEVLKLRGDDGVPVWSGRRARPR